MTDDIVTRLRKEFNDCTCSGFNDCTCAVCHGRHQCDLYDLLGQSADEIERLRKMLDEGLRLGAIGAIVTEKWKIK